MPKDLDTQDDLLFGCDHETGIVSVDFKESNHSDSVTLYVREGDKTIAKEDAFRPFLLAEEGVIEGCPGDFDIKELAGSAPLKVLISFENWKDAVAAKKWLSSATGYSPSSTGAPYLFINDPVQQYLMLTGKTMFKETQFESLKRLQIDIECTTTEGYEFCNANRKGDSIIAIAMGNPDGSTDVLSVVDMTEKELLERFVQVVREQDPDVIEGHNFFNFDLPYIVARAKRHKVELALGRDGSTPAARPSRFNAGERTISYKRYDIFGRSVMDTLFMLHFYDISHRSLNGFGLKEAAIHFGISAKNRTYIPGSDIAKEFKKNPQKVLKYVADDVIETRGLSTLLSRSYFVQAAMLPFTYQNVGVRGNATKINALMIREYLRLGMAVPQPGESREFAGGYTDLFETGVIENVHHCDVRSLYPSLMLTRELGPACDEAGVFLSMLNSLKIFRLQAKEKMNESKDDKERNYYDALQTAFKVLINSFYGYLGFTLGNFNDYDAAEEVTAQGRDLLSSMINWLSENGARPVEIDTDGVYFVPPDGTDQDEAQFRQDFQESLPDGIEVEFDGEYESMYSYKMKNYALLSHDGEMIIKGGALKSRGLEPFQRDFLEDIIRLQLERKADQIPLLKDKYEKAIRERSMPIEKLAKTETLQDAPSTYQAKRDNGKTRKRASYELALSAEREYRAGDQISYYVTGDKKTVTVYSSAKLVSAWNADNRDENVPYYVAKLLALYKKFGQESEQGELF